jgi:hypothetical protein
MRLLKILVFGVSVLLPLSSPHADRHCSYARESAFYAREFAAESRQAPANECRAKRVKALDRLENAMAELEVCSCAAAEAPLRAWLNSRPATSGASCSAEMDSISSISQFVLKQVETCF